MSIVFDRAVEFYDQTRALPPELADAPIEALMRAMNLQPNARVLELGIGTGRIAIPLANKIERVTGIDLSPGMMGVVRKKIARTGLRIDLAQADAVYLPFPGDCYDLIYAVHVLHLVSGWQGAVREARRALKPGGCLVVSWHRRMPDSPNNLLRAELHRLVGAYGISTRRPGAQSEQDIQEELRKWGSEPQLLDVVDWTEALVPAQILDELDRQYYSETWMIPRAVMDAVMPELRSWAEQQFGSLDRPLMSPFNFRWLIARKGPP